MSIVFRQTWVSPQRVRRFVKRYAEKLAPYIKLLMINMSDKNIELRTWSRVFEKLQPTFITINFFYSQWDAPPSIALAFQDEVAALMNQIGIHCNDASVVFLAKAVINPKRLRNLSYRDAYIHKEAFSEATFSDRGLLRMAADQVPFTGLCLSNWSFCWQHELGSPGYANLAHLTLDECHFYSDRTLNGTVRSPSGIKELAITRPILGSGSPLRDILRYVAPNLVQLTLTSLMGDWPGSPLHDLHFPNLKYLKCTEREGYRRSLLGVPIAPKLVALEYDGDCTYPFEEEYLRMRRYVLDLYCRRTSLRKVYISIGYLGDGDDNGYVHFDALEDFGPRQLEVVVRDCSLDSYRFLNVDLLFRTESLSIGFLRMLGRRGDGLMVWLGTEMIKCPLLEKVMICGHDAESLMSKLVAPRLCKIEIYEERWPAAAETGHKAQGESK